MTLETSVPSGEPSYECAYCGQPFSHREYLVLHRGLKHGDELSDEEVNAFHEAYEEESEELRLFRLKALALLVLLYFGFLFMYSIVP
ncbi:C2H2-type zinc finger protein [Haladaptatus caseinilyticus]|uniref:C2H2-type zinc finger protein n=1 Tax=Haladaptatus caseinilyticus TaxID=2993314 RepID=UPI00224B0A72|nr:C2H2-type zinc finger protein [Haladaptatus caseinilyticus]